QLEWRPVMIAGDDQNNMVVSDSIRRHDLELRECRSKVNGELQICVKFRAFEISGMHFPNRRSGRTLPVDTAVECGAGITRGQVHDHDLFARSFRDNFDGQWRARSE